MSKRKEFINDEILLNYNCRNSNIIKLFGFYEYKDYFLLIMELMNNKDLKNFIKKFIKKYEFISETLCGFFVIQIVNALLYLKGKNIIHRDIKPENIMLNHLYTAKLGDFSLARKIESNNFQITKSGTLPYLPPENMKKGNLEIPVHFTDRLDVFSLGVIMYNMLYNEHPFKYKVFYLIFRAV